MLDVVCILLNMVTAMELSDYIALDDIGTVDWLLIFQNMSVYTLMTEIYRLHFCTFSSSRFNFGIRIPLYK